MKYEIIVKDSQERIDSLQFVRQLQSFIELNFRSATISKVTVIDEYYPVVEYPNSEKKETINHKLNK